jgi:hypothetical protein
LLPIPASPKVEGGISGDLSVDGDHHILTVDSDSCILWESYHSYTRPGGGWNILSSAAFDLRSDALRPAGWTSADAAGFPILPLLLRADEASSGAINHALRFTIQSSKIRNTYAWPATHLTTGGGSSISKPPMGQLFRLNAGYVIPTTYTAQAQAILLALKRYGMYVADGGSDMYIQGEPSVNWDDNTISQVQTVPHTAFEAVDLSPIMARSGFNLNSARVPSAGPTAPDPPTLNGISAGPGSATLSFTAPANNGGSAITGYLASCAASGQPTRSAGGTASPLTVGGLTPGVAYSCSIAAGNSVGTGTASGALAVTPGSTTVLQFAAATYTVAEAAGNVMLTVSRSGDTSGTVSIQYSTCDSACATTATAIAGADFLGGSGTLTFGPGVSSQTVSINLLNDNAIEGNESFNVVLSNPVGAAIGAINAARVTILDGQAGQLSTVGQLFNIPGPGNADSAFLRFVNLGSTGIPVAATLYDQSGTMLGTQDLALTAGLPAKGVLVLATTDIAALFGVSSWTGRAWMEVRSTAPAGTLQMQNLVRSTSLTNMSCVSDRYALNLPAVGNADQAFVRLYNIGSSAGAVRGTLYDQSGAVLGNPNSVIQANLGAKSVSVLTADQIQSATGAPGWTGRAWLDLSADFGAGLKIMNLIRDSSNTLNNMSCVAP